MTANYAALGQYHAAKETAAEGRDARNGCLFNLAGQIQRLMGDAEARRQFSSFDFEAAQRWLDLAREKHQAMLESLREANAVAAPAGQRPIALRD